MPTFENQVLIERPVYDVFKYVADFSNDSSWRNVDRVGMTSADPIRVGTMVAMTRKIAGFKGFVNGDVVEYDRNKKLVMKGSFWGFPFVRTVEFEHRGQQTNLKQTIDIRTRWMVWFNAFFSVALRGALSAELNTVKQLLDTHGDRKSV